MRALTGVQFFQYLSGYLKCGCLLLLDLTSKLPFSFRYLITTIISAGVFIFSRKRRISVRKNLKAIFNRNPSLLQVYRVFFEYGKYWAELPVINKIWSSNVKIYHDDSFPPVEKCFLGITFHIGNFEIFGRIINQVNDDGFNVVVERLKPQYIADFFKRIRLRHRIKTIAHDDLRQIVGVIKSDKPLGILGDRMIDGRGVEVRLFGKRTRMPLNIVDFALQRKIPVYVAYCINENRQLNIFSRRIDGNCDFESAVNMIVSTLQEAVTSFPYQWHVLEEF